MLETLAPSSVTVSITADGGDKVVVPYEPVMGDDDLVSAARCTRITVGITFPTQVMWARSTLALLMWCLLARYLA